MHLRVLLPYQVFVEKTGVSRIVADTRAGSYGLLPQRLDCTAALTPGILMYETEADGQVFLAVDEGVLVKAGAEVLVSVRRAVGGADLQHLHELVAKEFLDVDERERDARSTMARLESGFLHRFAALRHD
ncbi:MAG: F0F1 ATP synthase subunit epsilon [Planctomycetota bacterium]